MIQGIKRSEREYRKLDMLSSSDIRKFATDGRRAFYDRIYLGKEQEITRSITIGNLVHCLLLEPEEFDKKYYKSLCSVKPTGNMLNFVNALWKHTLLNTTEEGEVIKEFKYLAQEAYKDSGHKRELFETVLNNFKGGEPEKYYTELREAHIGQRTVVSVEDLSIAEKVVDKLKNHEYTRDVFNKKSLRELQIDNFEIDGIKLKAMIDDVNIDENTKTITPSDLKVIWSNEDFYKNYYLKRRADIQGYIYDAALKHMYPGYTVLPITFIIADSTNFNAPLKFKMTKKMLQDAYSGFHKDGIFYKGISQIITEIKWHTEYGIWDISYENFQNKGFIYE